MISEATQEPEELAPGLKYKAPKSLPRSEHFRYRYEPVVEQFTKNLMQDGKLATAQKVCSLFQAWVFWVDGAVKIEPVTN